jgi:hypothetical protein
VIAHALEHLGIEVHVRGGVSMAHPPGTDGQPGSLDVHEGHAGRRQGIEHEARECGIH